MYPWFEDDIKKMNKTYELAPVNTNDVGAVQLRLNQFKEILGKEFDELLDITPDILAANGAMDVRVALADLLGDIIVYCASEALRWQIPLPATLRIIMESNFSKLDADGKPIKDENDKFQKGPNYWKPEPSIERTIRHYDQLATMVRPAGSSGYINMDYVVEQALAGMEPRAKEQQELGPGMSPQLARPQNPQE